MTIKYDLIGAYKFGVKEHPERDVIKLGMKVLKFEGCPIADCVFMEVDDMPENLPPYIEETKYKIE